MCTCISPIDYCNVSSQYPARQAERSTGQRRARGSPRQDEELIETIDGPAGGQGPPVS